MELMGVLLYRSVVGKCYDTAKSFFMHGGGKMKLQTVKRY